MINLPLLDGIIFGTIVVAELITNEYANGVGSVSCELAIANRGYTWNNVQRIAHWSK